MLWQLALVNGSRIYIPQKCVVFSLLVDALLLVVFWVLDIRASKYYKMYQSCLSTLATSWQRFIGAVRTRLVKVSEGTICQSY